MTESPDLATIRARWRDYIAKQTPMHLTHGCDCFGCSDVQQLLDILAAQAERLARVNASLGKTAEGFRDCCREHQQLTIKVLRLESANRGLEADLAAARAVIEQQIGSVMDSQASASRAEEDAFLLTEQLAQARAEAVALRDALRQHHERALGQIPGLWVGRDQYIGSSLEQATLAALARPGEARRPGEGYCPVCDKEGDCPCEGYDAVLPKEEPTHGD